MDFSARGNYAGIMEARPEHVDAAPTKIGHPIICRKCGATVAWAKTRSGKSILMDHMSVPMGQFTIVGEVRDDTIVAKLSYRPPGSARFMTHFVTCPDRRPARSRNPNKYRRDLSPRDAAFKKNWDTRAKASISTR